MISTIDRKLRPARSRESGQAVIEATLLAPWILVLFLGIFNVGIYSYSLSSAENALRIASLEGSWTPSKFLEKAAGPCNRVLAENAGFAEHLDVHVHVHAARRGVVEVCTAGPLTVTSIESVEVGERRQAVRRL